VFWSRDLDLDPMIFIYELTPIPYRYNGHAKMNFLRQGFRMLSSDRHTYENAYRHVYTRVVNKITLSMWCWQDDYTALHLAVQYGKYLAAQTLLGYGADVNVTGGTVCLASTRLSAL